MPLRDTLLALSIVAIWGLNFVAIKVGVSEVPPLLLAALRFFLAAVPAVFFIRRPMVPLRFILGFGLVLGVAKFGIQFVAVRLGMPAGLTSLVLQVQVFLTIALAFVLLGERPNAWQLAGAATALAGLGLITWERLQGAAVIPFLLVLASALAWAFANIIMKKAGQVDMLSFVVWTSLVPPLPLLALSLVLEGPDAVLSAVANPSWIAIGSLAFLVYPTTVLGYAVWGNLLSRYPAATVTPFALLIPVIAILSTGLILGESVSGLVLAGGALILGGVALNVFAPRLLAALAAPKLRGV